MRWAVLVLVVFGCTRDIADNKAVNLAKFLDPEAKCTNIYTANAEGCAKADSAICRIHERVMQCTGQQCLEVVGGIGGVPLWRSPPEAPK